MFANEQCRLNPQGFAASLDAWAPLRLSMASELEQLSVVRPPDVVSHLLAEERIFVFPAAANRRGIGDKTTQTVNRDLSRR
jgi:hypothetical protein